MDAICIFAESEDNVLTNKEYALALKFHEETGKTVYQAFHSNDSDNILPLVTVIGNVQQYTQHNVLTADDVKIEEQYKAGNTNALLAKSPKQNQNNIQPESSDAEQTQKAYDELLEKTKETSASHYWKTELKDT